MSDWYDFVIWVNCLVPAAGLAYLIARRRRCPRAAWLGAAGLAVFLALQLTQRLPWPESAWIRRTAERAGADRYTAMGIQCWLGYATQTGCYLLLAWAAVLGRRPAGGSPVTEPRVPDPASDET